MGHCFSRNRILPFFTFLLVLFPASPRGGHSARATARCSSRQIAKGERGEGVLRFCDNGSTQELFLSGELDSAAANNSVREIRALFVRRTRGDFRVVTRNADGGLVELHQQLMMAVENACRGGCRITTIAEGRCESACNQLHLSCVRGSRTLLRPGAELCEHASHDATDPSCRRCDKLAPEEDCDLCSPEEAIREYKDRCGRLAAGRGLDIDPARKRQLESFVDGLARSGVFDSDRLICVAPPWAEATGSARAEPRRRETSIP